MNANSHFDASSYTHITYAVLFTYVAHYWNHKLNTGLNDAIFGNFRRLYNRIIDFLLKVLFSKIKEFQ